MHCPMERLILAQGLIRNPGGKLFLTDSSLMEQQSKASMATLFDRLKSKCGKKIVNGKISSAPINQSGKREIVRSGLSSSFFSLGRESFGAV